jgi:hypothetical protein
VVRRAAADSAPGRDVVTPAARQRRETELAKFIDAHGGRLGPFRGYGSAQVTPPTTSPRSLGERV